MNLSWRPGELRKFCAGGHLTRYPPGLRWVSRAKLGARPTGCLLRLRAAVNRQTRSTVPRSPPPNSITRVQSAIDHVYRPSVQLWPHDQALITPVNKRTFGRMTPCPERVGNRAAGERLATSEPGLVERTEREEKNGAALWLPLCQEVEFALDCLPAPQEAAVPPRGMERVYTWCPGWELNPHSPYGEKDFKSFASASFATRARGATRRGAVTNVAQIPGPACRSISRASPGHPSGQDGELEAEQTLPDEGVAEGVRKFPDTPDQLRVPCDCR